MSQPQTRRPQQPAHPPDDPAVNATWMTPGRLVSFSDGVMAIAITIMVMNIPLPASTASDELIRFFSAILVFFVSFIVVGAQWARHHVLLHGTQTISNMTLWRNLLYLFLLSLVPIFTKWVMQNVDDVIPAVGYAVVFVLVNVSQFVLWDSLMRQPEHAERQRRPEEVNARRQLDWRRRFGLMAGALILVVLLTLVYPRVAAVLFIGFPVASSLLNLFIDNRRRFRPPVRR